MNDQSILMNDAKFINILQKLQNENNEAYIIKAADELSDQEIQSKMQYFHLQLSRFCKFFFDDGVQIIDVKEKAEGSEEYLIDGETDAKVSKLRQWLGHIYNNLLKSSVAKTKQFQIFQEYIFNKIEQEVEDESEDEQTKKAIKEEYSKKVKNTGKVIKGKTKQIEKIKKITYKGEDYDIDNWIECEACKTWRIVNSKYSHKKVSVKRLGKNA